MNLLKKIIGSRNDRILKDYQKILSNINEISNDFKNVKDTDFPEITNKLKNDLKNGKDLDQILPYAFALVREASERVMNMRHFDEQIIGGLALHNGKIAEMKTGEGKTLVATLPAYLNALKGNGVHIITVNDYLAKRDCDWMSKLYNYLGLSTGVILSGQSLQEKKIAYEADIIYGTNNEFGFDYLRDNMVFSLEEKVQNKLSYAIVDEVDSILIDEARTPLIISGATSESLTLYKKMNSFVKYFKEGDESDQNADFFLDEKSNQAFLTEKGHETYEKLLFKNQLINNNESLYDPNNINLLHFMNTALRANYLYSKDIDYIVEESKIIIIDEFTGRKMPGRRWGDGLHQAIEAKENLNIENENQTLASITFQNYFRLYEKLSGMTGTADTEAQEFQEIYELEVIVIPPHKKMIRKDFGDLVYLTIEEKYNAIIEDIKNCQKNKQPVLIGTASIESSEYLSKALKKENISHNVLNAKQHERESMIIENAGSLNSVTIATNMAGRGTDIVLGGKKNDIEEHKWTELNLKVLESGGLHVIGTERHESRRVDNQLRGRAGRQGDPGSSRFYLSLEDNLMRIFASDKVSTFMKKLGMEKGEAIEHKWVTKAIGNAQKKVEGHNFDIRKHLLDYDDVANEQRKYIYNKRNDFLAKDNREELTNIIIEQVFTNIIESNLYEENKNSEMNETLQRDFHIEIDAEEIIKNSIKKEEAREKFIEKIFIEYKKNISSVEKDIYQDLIKEVFINIVDKSWIEHIQAMDHLRQGIGLRSYAQKNPKQEYKREAFEMFSIMQDSMHYNFISLLYRIDYNTTFSKKEKTENLNYNRSDADKKSNTKNNKNKDKRNRKQRKKKRK
jgi:preprotein translocase subunit SecA